VAVVHGSPASPSRAANVKRVGAETDGTAVSADPAGPARLRELLDRASEHAGVDGDSEASARQFALEARILARAVGDLAGEAEALYHMASFAQTAGEIDEAFTLAIESAAVAAQTQAELIESRATHLISIVHLRAENFVEALEHATHSLEVCRSTDHHVEEGNILNTIAAIHHSMGDADRAMSTYQAALAVSEPLGRFGFAALVCGNISRIRASLGEFDAAVKMGCRAVELARRHSPEILGSLLADLGESYTGSGEHDDAARCFAEAHRVGDLPADVAVLLAEGRAALARGGLEQSIDLLEVSLELARQFGREEFELEINDLLATAYKHSGRFEEALDRREHHDALKRAMTARSAELRLRTQRLAHEALIARQQAEIFRISSSGLPGTGAVVGIADPAVAQLEAFERLAILAEFRDADTGEHTKRVGDLAAEIAHAIGRPPEWCERLRLAARLHDIGKVAVPDSVLLKPGSLTVEEFELMKTHTTVGHQILAGSSSPLFQLAAELALNHHEWWDGSGYPRNLSGQEIPLSGRIVALADVFDALSSRRVYKRAWPLGEAARFVISGRGVQFDPDLVDSFASVVVARYPSLAAELS
jgi:putative two-component system response regulator